MLSTANVTVRSPATAAPADIARQIRATTLNLLFMIRLSSWLLGVKQRRRDIVEGKGGHDE